MGMAYFLFPCTEHIKLLDRYRIGTGDSSLGFTWCRIGKENQWYHTSLVETKAEPEKMNGTNLILI